MLQTNNQEQPDEDNGGDGGGDGAADGDGDRKQNAPVECNYEEWEDSTDCNFDCDRGRGTKFQIRRTKDSRCTEITQQVNCWARDLCRNKGSIGIHFIGQIKDYIFFLLMWWFYMQNIVKAGRISTNVNKKKRTK